ncbi:MAG: OPT/YSL family transporter [Myxococcota bacterium]
MTEAVSPVEKRGLLPPIGSARYHVMLSAIAIFVLGPLGGVTASYMNFSLGFFVGGQVLAGILGSAVTYFYGPEGKHGANYMQTMAASVASMSAMGVLIQAMTWLGLPQPPLWQLILYFLCIGMFGVGVGMLYTPILVDRLNLTFPSGLAVANILRALTDKNLLKRSISQLGGGIAVGFGGAKLVEVVEWLGATGLSTSTFGAGMIVGARIGVPAIVVGFIGRELTPWLRDIGWLGPHDPFRKIGFIIALGTILGAAIVDLTLIFRQAITKMRSKADPAAVAVPVEEWKKTNTRSLLLWAGFWGVGLVIVATQVLNVPALYVLFAMGLVFVFLMINGISLGISDSNPISSAFVVSVLLMSAIGLKDPGVGLMAASILLVSTAVGCDMQQDRSTGWRLGTPRNIQFRYQVVGVFMGAIMAVVMAKVFMQAYPVLAVDTFSHPEQKVAQWQSAMTYKFVGALRGLTSTGGHQLTGLSIGIGIGFVTEVLRKLLKSSAAYQAFRVKGEVNKAIDFTLDAVILPSPYASSFGGFVEWGTAAWYGVGGIASSLYNEITERIAAGKPKNSDIPEDMSTTSLTGGGLIAGDSLYALYAGISGLLASIL